MRLQPLVGEGPVVERVVAPRWGRRDFRPSASRGPQRPSVPCRKAEWPSSPAWRTHQSSVWPRRRPAQRRRHERGARRRPRLVRLRPALLRRALACGIPTSRPPSSRGPWCGRRRRRRAQGAQGAQVGGWARRRRLHVVPIVLCDCTFKDARLTVKRELVRGDGQTPRCGAYGGRQQPHKGKLEKSGHVAE